MYYRLSPQFALRSYERIGAALLSKGGGLKTIAPEDFRVLLLCDGVTDLAELPLGDIERAALERFTRSGIVREQEIPKAIVPSQAWRKIPNRYVRSVMWSITGRCNFRCRHCYMDAPDGSLGELSHQEAMKLVEELGQCGVSAVELTGGECLIREDFWEIVDGLLDNGIEISQIYTNGWLVDEKLLEQFQRRCIRPSFCFSHDGIGWHDWMRGIKGAEVAVAKALQLCKSYGFSTGVEICVHRGNAHTLGETIRALVKAGVSAIRVGAVANSKLWVKNSEGNAYDVRKYYEDMIAYIPQFYADGCPISLQLGGVIEISCTGKFNVTTERYSGTEKCQDCPLCSSAQTRAYIGPDGRLLPCIMMTSVQPEFYSLFPKITEIGLQKSLSDSFFTEFIDRRIKNLVQANEKCKTCPYVLKCGGGCRASALEHSGDLMGSDEDQCILWNEGYVDRIRKTAEEAVARYCPGEMPHESTAG